MKIGAFSKQNNISIDTIRYYIKQNMLLPSKNNSQYDFDKSTEDDLKTIISLKQFDLSISEIKDILSYMRLSKFELKQQSLFIHEILKNKKDYINKEIIRLSSIESSLNKYIKNYISKEDSIHNNGIPLSFISKMQCNKCASNYNLDSTKILNNQIINGQLKCLCGEFSIIDGIIINKESINNIKYGYLNYTEYLKETNSDFFQLCYKSSKWIEQNINFETLNNSTILELGPGMGIFLRQIYNRLPKSSTYICIDYDLNKLIHLKNMISYSKEYKNIIFIASDFKNIPLKNNTIDTCFDISGRSNFYLHQLPNISDTLFLNDFKNIFKNNSYYFSLNCIFEKFQISDPIIPPKFQYLFTKSTIENEINKADFSIINTKKSVLLPYGGQYEDFQNKGDSTFFYGIVSQRKI